MLNGIFIGALIAHIIGYKEHYISIATSFVSTYALKKLIKNLDSDIADAFALGGYAQTVTCVMILLLAIKSSGNDGVTAPPKEGEEIIGGFAKRIIDKFIRH